MSEIDEERAIVHCDTTKGPITLEFHRRWSPFGYDRAVTLFERHFYDHTHFFRVVPDFLVQFGITYSNDPELVEMGNAQTIPDDPQLDPAISFDVGTISYAGSGPHSRTSQLFFSLTKDNENFGTELWETPVGVVVQGIEYIQQFYHEYGDGPPFGRGPSQDEIHTGRAYIDEHFSLLDSFQQCHTERIRPGRIDNAKGQHARERMAVPTSRIDLKLVTGGLLLLVIVSVFVRSLLGTNERNPKKRK
jgi:cyclophilin family peptidyl-prolyl cis-trans isomerase